MLKIISYTRDQIEAFDLPKLIATGKALIWLLHYEPKYYPTFSPIPDAPKRVQTVDDASLKRIKQAILIKCRHSPSAGLDEIAYHDFEWVLGYNRNSGWRYQDETASLKQWRTLPTVQNGLAPTNVRRRQATHWQGVSECIASNDKRIRLVTHQYCDDDWEEKLFGIICRDLRTLKPYQVAPFLYADPKRLAILKAKLKPKQQLVVTRFYLQDVLGMNLEDESQVIGVVNELDDQHKMMALDCLVELGVRINVVEYLCGDRTNWLLGVDLALCYDVDFTPEQINQIINKLLNHLSDVKTSYDEAQYAKFKSFLAKLPSDKMMSIVDSWLRSCNADSSSCIFDMNVIRRLTGIVAFNNQQFSRLLTIMVVSFKEKDPSQQLKITDISIIESVLRRLKYNATPADPFNCEDYSDLISVMPPCSEFSGRETILGLLPLKQVVKFLSGAQIPPAHRARFLSDRAAAGAGAGAGVDGRQYRFTERLGLRQSKVTRRGTRSALDRAADQRIETFLKMESESSYASIAEFNEVVRQWRKYIESDISELPPSAFHIIYCHLSKVFSEETLATDLRGLYLKKIFDNAKRFEEKLQCLEQFYGSKDMSILLQHLQLTDAGEINLEELVKNDKWSWNLRVALASYSPEKINSYATFKALFSALFGGDEFPGHSCEDIKKNIYLFLENIHVTYLIRWVSESAKERKFFHHEIHGAIVRRLLQHRFFLNASCLCFLIADNKDSDAIPKQASEIQNTLMEKTSDPKTLKNFLAELQTGYPLSDWSIRVLAKLFKDVTALLQMSAEISSNALFSKLLIKVVINNYPAKTLSLHDTHCLAKCLLQRKLIATAANPINIAALFEEPKLYLPNVGEFKGNELLLKLLPPEIAETFLVSYEQKLIFKIANCRSYAELERLFASIDLERRGDYFGYLPQDLALGYRITHRILDERLPAVTPQNIRIYIRYYNDPAVQQAIHQGKLSANQFLFSIAVLPGEYGRGHFQKLLSDPLCDLLAYNAAKKTLLQVIESSSLSSEEKASRIAMWQEAFEKKRQVISDHNLALHLGISHKATIKRIEFELPKLAEHEIPEKIPTLDDADVERFHCLIKWLTTHPQLQAYTADFAGLARNTLIHANKVTYKLIVQALEQFCISINGDIQKQLAIQFSRESLLQLRNCPEGVLNALAELRGKHIEEYFVSRVIFAAGSLINTAFKVRTGMEVHAPVAQVAYHLGIDVS